MKTQWDRRALIDAEFFTVGTVEGTADSIARATVEDVEGSLRDLEVSPRARVLDLGCGTGRLSAPLAARVGDVVAIDVSEEMIAEARRRHGRLTNLEFRVGSGRDLATLQSESFDLVLSYAVLPHLPRSTVAAYVPEVGRVLRLGGVFRYQFWIGEAVDLDDRDTLGVRVYSMEEVRGLHAVSGLSEPEIRTVDYLDPHLKIRPCWVTARRAQNPSERPAPLQIGAPGDGIGVEEREARMLLRLAMQRAQQGKPQQATAALAAARAAWPQIDSKLG